jgi:hypothetical protein
MSKPCGCIRSPGVIAALFATLAAIAFIAQDACLDAGGRLSDSAWTCETAAGATVSLWTLSSPTLMALAALVVGVPTYLAVNALVRRLF